MSKPVCSVVGCDRRAKTKRDGLCHPHQRRLDVYGDPTAGPEIGSGQRVDPSPSAPEPPPRLGCDDRELRSSLDLRRCLSAAAACQDCGALLAGDEPTDITKAARIHARSHGHRVVVTYNTPGTRVVIEPPLFPASLIPNPATEIPR